MIARPVLMAVEPAVAEWLARQLDQPRLAVFPHVRQIVRERIAVPHVSFFHQQRDGLIALRARAPTDRTLSGSLQKHVRGAPDAVLFFLPGQVAGDLMVVAVPRDFVAALDPAAASRSDIPTRLD